MKPSPKYWEKSQPATMLDCAEPPLGSSAASARTVRARACTVGFLLRPESLRRARHVHENVTRCCVETVCNRRRFDEAPVKTRRRLRAVCRPVASRRDADAAPERLVELARAVPAGAERHLEHRELAR